MKKNSGFIQLPVIAIAILLAAAVTLPVVSNFVAQNKKITTQQRAAPPVPRPNATAFPTLSTTSSPTPTQAPVVSTLCSDDSFLTSNCDGQCISSERCVLKSPVTSNPKFYKCCTMVAASCNALLVRITAAGFSKRCGDIGYDKIADINKDGVIDVIDAQIISGSGGSGGDETYCAARLADTSDPCTSSICDLDRYLTGNCDRQCTGLQTCLLKSPVTSNPKFYQCCTPSRGTPIPTIRTVTPLPTGCHGDCRSDCSAALCPVGKIVGLPCACSSTCATASCSSGCSGISASCYANDATWETHICCVNPPPSLTPTPIPSPGCTGSCNSSCTAAACPAGKIIGACLAANCSNCNGQIGQVATCSKSGVSGWTTSICCVGPSSSPSPTPTVEEELSPTPTVTPTATPGTTGSCTGGCYGSITNCSTNCNYGRTACTQLSNTEVQSVCGWPSGSIGFCCKVGPVATATPGGPSPTAAPRATLTPVASVTPGGASVTPPAGCACPAGKPAKTSGNADCNGVVDRQDLNYWINQFASGQIDPVRSADFDCVDGVNRQDLARWINGFADPGIPH